MHQQHQRKLLSSNYKNSINKPKTSSQITLRPKTHLMKNQEKMGQNKPQKKNHFPSGCHQSAITINKRHHQLNSKEGGTRIQGIQSKHSQISQGVKRQIQTARLASNGGEGKNHRKNTSPVKITEISQYLRNASFSPSHLVKSQAQDERNKGLLQKLLKIGCKVVKLSKQQSHRNKCDNTQKTEEKTEVEDPSSLNVSCNARFELLRYKLKKNIINLSEHPQQIQFQNLLLRKKLQIKQQPPIQQEIPIEQYSNRQIYQQIRKQYKIDPGEQSLRQITTSRQTHTERMLKKREEIKSRFTVKSHQALSYRDIRIQQDEHKIQGW